MGKIITIDPITRIEGHLKIDIEVSGGKITNAWSSGTMYRGIEQILIGRDPREAWLFTQRFCGVCTTVHAIASVRAVENALDHEIPVNAQLIRNLIIAGHSIFDHIVHFYHLSALDWVDVVSATKASAKDAANFAQLISPNWHRNTQAEMQAVKDRVIGVVKSGQLGIFNNGYWGHKAMELPPHVNLMAVAHYLQALDYQRKINDVVGLLGAKTPHIQNLAVGGVTNAIDLNEQTSLNVTTLLKVKSYFDEIKSFVNDVYLTDVCAVGTVYINETQYGKGVANYMAVPEFPIDGLGKDFSHGIKGGTLIDGKVKEITSFQDKYFEDNVSESIARSYYDGDWDKHPYEQTTDPKVSEYDREGRYSWAKAPRFQGRPMQVGPLANVLSGFLLGDERVVKYATIALKKINLFGKVLGISTAANLDVNGLVGALQSSLGRHAARAVRCACVVDVALDHWQLLVDNIAKGDTDIFNKPVFPKGEQQGFGFHEAPRGTLSHWIVIKDGKIKNFQAVVPSTWNAGPRDGKDQKGPYEMSLIGNRIRDEKRPLEALRVIHSFDPCLACAVHAFDPDGNELGVANTNI